MAVFQVSGNKIKYDSYNYEPHFINNACVTFGEEEEWYIKNDS